MTCALIRLGLAGAQGDPPHSPPSTPPRPLPFFIWEPGLIDNALPIPRVSSGSLHSQVGWLLQSVRRNFSNRLIIQVSTAALLLNAFSICLVITRLRVQGLGPGSRDWQTSVKLTQTQQAWSVNN